jgi:hypothetical protein
MNDRELLVYESVSLFSFLKNSLEYGEDLLGIANDYIRDENGEERPACTLNKEAISDLVNLCKKISSKADILQNKIQELSKHIS